MEKKPNLIVDLSFKFSLDVISQCRSMQNDKGFVISKQLLRSGTSIGANLREAQNGESRKDFIHKLKIAAKEAEETEYWIDLCNESDHLSSNLELKNQIISIKKLLNKIIGSSKSGIN